jgi:sugar lactone lactonase YvrE
MHLFPQLRKVEAQFERELVVIGVHAGKFHAERETANIRQAVMRLELEHPVANDRQFRVWRSFGVNAWPTLVFLDPEGRAVGQRAGEASAESLADVVRGLVREFDAQGKIDRTPLPARLERGREPGRSLAFPAKVLAVPDGPLFISDSGHNRVLMVRLNGDGVRGHVEAVIGNGAAGMVDGNFGQAAFHRPHGLALVGSHLLYVADTENHAIRQVNLLRGTVSTVAGTGEQARRMMASGPGDRVALNSPWDLLAQDGRLYMAMAGSHQLWQMDLASLQVRPFAGTGAEALVDGPLLSAVLAQPSGLTTDGERLYFADSESSAIRWAEFEPRRGRVGTVVGTGLFDFGDKDGVGNEARLQHPLGVAWSDGVLYVADTYNNRVKRVDPATRSSQAFVGSGTAELRDGDLAAFYEPGGISAAGGRLYVADTNNHRVRVIDVKTRQVNTLALEGAGFSEVEGAPTKSVLTS